MNSKRFFAAALSLVLLLFAVFAGAQPFPGAEQFEPKASDQGMKFITAIFGDASAHSAVTTTLGEAFRVFNAGVLVFASIMFVYVAVVGVMRSAQDGEVLGKAWSSMWVPARFALGVGMLFPTASGFSFAQIFVLWIAGLGVGIGSGVWGAAVEKFVAGTGNAQAEYSLDDPLTTRKYEDLVFGVLRAEACLASHQRNNPGYDKLGISEGVDETLLARAREAQKRRKGVLAPPSGVVFRWGDTAGGTGIAKGACGTASTMTLVDDSYDTNTGSLGKSGFANSSNVNIRAAYHSAMEVAIAAQADGLRKVSAYLRNAGRAWLGGVDPNKPQIVENLDPQVKEALAGAVLVYKAAIRPAVHGLTTINSNLLGAPFIESAKNDGFISAGLYYFQLARILSEGHKVVSFVPAVTAPELGTGGGVVSSGMDSAADQQLVAKHSRLSLLSLSPGEIKQKITDEFAFDGVTKWIAYRLGGNPENPQHMLIQIKNTGDYMMVWTESAVASAYSVYAIAAGMATLASTGGIVKAIEGFRAIIDPAMTVMTIAASAAFAVGVTMSLIIPLLPFMIWAGAILGWLMAVAEAVIAAPIHWAAHLHPEGDEVMGKGVAGYMILVEMMCRPAFLVLGLLISLFTMDIFMRWVGEAFWASVGTTQSGSTTGLFSMIVLVCLYVLLTMTMVRRIMAFTTSLPAQVFRWIGGPNAMFDQSNEFTRDTMDTTNSVTKGAAGLGAVAGAGIQGSRKKIADAVSAHNNPATSNPAAPSGSVAPPAAP